MCSSSVPLLSGLQIHPDEDGSGQWVWYGNFVTFMQQNHLPDDKLLKTSNIQRELKGHNQGTGIRTIGNQQVVYFSSVLRYIFHHAEDYKICRRICNQIESAITDKLVEHAASSIFELYKVIAKKNLKSPVIENVLMASLPIDEKDIPALEPEYKQYFSDLEWKKICLFEWHFHKECKTDNNSTYEEIVKLRWDYFDAYHSMYRLSSALYTHSKEIILHQLRRKATAEVQEGIRLVAKQTHVPSILDISVTEALGEHFNDIESVVCIDCLSGVCKHPPCIHVCIELAHEDISMVDDISTIVKSHLASKHCEDCSSVIFFEQGSLSPYRGNDNNIHRFHLRDDIYLGHMKHQIVYNWQSHGIADWFDYGGHKQKCMACHSHVPEKPLNWRDFDLVTEWLLEVPLGIQVLLETFINKKSLNKTKEKEKFIKGKLARLYSNWDSLLHVLNRQYSGIFQDLNTQELALNYHNVNTVFSVASRGGISKSLTSAERNIKKTSDADKCYYNTYIKQYPMEYESAAGAFIKQVSLRECYLVLCLDNLVRLTFHGDPIPGESRSSQLCTLPITVKGLPKDNMEIETWHDISLCDGSATCPCKDTKLLNKDDIDLVLLQLTDEERQARQKFDNVCTWGMTPFWVQMENNEIWDLVEEAILQIPSDPAETLNQSFQGLVLDSDPNVEENQSGEEDNTIEADQTEEISDQSDTEQDLHTLLNEVTIHHAVHNGSTNISEIEPIETIEAAGVLHADLSEFMADISEASILPQENYGSNNTGDSEVEKQEEENLDLNIPLASLPFELYIPPPLLCRHPPPAIGRDDDITKLKEVLDDLLIKCGYCFGTAALSKERILFAPDHKISNNLLKLMQSNDKYKTFLPEFPVLHLRKSKITNICSGYKDAGVLHLLKYMRDDDAQNEWSKLVSAENIESATRMIKRLALSLHLAFLISFIKTLPPSKARSLKQDLGMHEQLHLITSKWNKMFTDFMTMGASQNATFALHRDIMHHCDEVGAIALAERLGGPQGYQLLLSSVKSSLPFAFLNGASSYAAFCVQLLYEHSRSGVFYQNMKQRLFSTPHKGSNVNFGLDTQREMDHKDALKSFRPRATVNAVLPRMSLVDTMSEINENSLTTLRFEESPGSIEPVPSESSGIKITSTDLKYIFRTASVILRQNGISTNPDPVPKNVYDKAHNTLPEVILDCKSYEVGNFLIHKYACQNGLFGLTPDDCPDVNQVQGPKQLVSKVKRGKSTTIRRMKIKPCTVQNTERKSKEIKRQKKVATETKIAHCLSSEMNTCQAVVKPDCSKASIQKSTGIRNAVVNILHTCCKAIGLYTETEEESEEPRDATARQAGKVEQLSNIGMIFMEIMTIPDNMAKDIVITTVEFAGVKFKTRAISGNEYLKFIENGLIKSIIRQAPNINRLIICEEKYSFTPDDFKAATRAKRQGKSTHSVAHLKVGSEIISSTTFDKAAVITTTEGKSLISNFLGKMIATLNVKKDVVLDVDSECHLDGCQCGDLSSNPCKCDVYTTPIRATFSTQGYMHQSRLGHIQQRKGEAEMSQVDWLQDCISTLREGEAILQFVTSGDIDAIPIHLFAISLYWPRRLDGTFKNPVYVLLQKRGSFDLYNMTAMIEVLEKHFSDRDIGAKLSFILCMGGNDYLPKYHGISHDKMAQTVLNSEYFMKELFLFDSHQDRLRYTGGLVNKEVYKRVIKHIYCPKGFNSDQLSFDEVRQMTIKLPNQNNFRNPQLWLPPPCALEKLADLLDYQIEYLFTVMNPSAALPNFLSKGCLKKTATGEIEYNLGPDSHTDDRGSLLKVDEAALIEKMQKAKLKQVRQKKCKKSVKRAHAHTPQKGSRRKIGPKTSTPQKSSDQHVDS